MWFLAILFVGLSILAAKLKPQNPNEMKPSALGDMQFPTAEEGRSVPVIFGTVKVASPNVTWYGDFSTEAITQRVKTGPCSSSDVTKGYKYYVGMQLSLVHGVIHELKEIWVGDKKAWQGNTALPSDGQKVTININSPNLFGGAEAEGGISGAVDFYFGTYNQSPSTYYGEQVGSTTVGNAYVQWCYPEAPTFNPNEEADAIEIGLYDYAYRTYPNITSNAQMSEFLTKYRAHFSRWNAVIRYESVPQVPAFRQICYAMLKHVYMGTSNYIRNWSFVMRRCPDVLNDGKDNINGDANPAHMIYEVLTDSTWGVGMSPTMIDLPSFKVASNTLYNEGLGLSMLIDGYNKADSFIQEILRHLDASLFTDVSTGKMTLKLIRYDYDINTLLTLDPSNVVKVQLTREAWPETVNEVKVNYVDRASDFSTKMTQAYDLANLYAQGGEVVSETLDFKGFSNGTSATNAAVRALKGMTFPISSARITANRQAYGLYPGAVFKLTWPPLGIFNQVFRCTRPQYGTLAEGSMEIDAIEDIYALSTTIFAAPPPTGWSEPVSSPVPITLALFDEAPYHWQGLTRWVSTVAVKPTPATYQYDVYTRQYGQPYQLTEEVTSFTPTGRIQGSMSKFGDAYDAVGIIVAPMTDMDKLHSLASDYELYNAAHLLQIGNEVIAWKTITAQSDGTYKISGLLRGALDSIPQDHADNDIVYFVTEGTGLTSRQKYDTDVQLYIKLLPKTRMGTLDIADATEYSFNTSSRCWRPYPPGNFRLNNQYAHPTVVTGDAVVSWAVRVRQQTQIVKQDSPDYTTAPEGQYKLFVLHNNTVVYQNLTYTGNGYTITPAQLCAWVPRQTTPITVKLLAINNTYEARHSRLASFAMAGYGMNYGQYYGGT